MLPADLEDRLIRRGLRMIRVSNGLGAAAANRLRALERELRRMLGAVDVGTMGRRELGALLREISAAITAAYRAIADEQIAQIGELAEVEAGWMTEAMEADRGVSEEAIAALLLALLTFGSPVAEQWRRQGATLAFNIAAQVRQAHTVKAPVQELLARVFGAPPARLPVPVRPVLEQAPRAGGSAAAPLPAQPGRPGQPAPGRPGTPIPPGQPPAPPAAPPAPVPPGRGQFDKAARDARMLAEAGAQAASQQARLAAMKANGINAIKWHAILDPKVCPHCGIRAGKLWDMDSQPIGHAVPLGIHPPAHWWCVTGDTLVKPSGRVRAVTRRHYHGDLVIIRTASGKELSCTPNHPVLTDRGWLPAGALDVGSNVISDRIGHRELDPVDVNAEHVPARIEEIARAFGESSGVLAREVPVTAPDFHGDGAGSDVAVIWADRELLAELDAAFPELAGQPILEVGNAELVAHPALGALDGILDGLPPAAARSMGSAGAGLPGLGRSPGGGDKVGFGAVAGLDVGLFEAAVDGDARDAESFCQCQHRFASDVPGNDLGIGKFVAIPVFVDVESLKLAPYGADGYARLARNILDGQAGEVFADAIVEKRLVSFSGHVYNLETETGWYVANGIINHNCRCLLIPMEYEAGPPADGGPEMNAFAQWLERKSRDQQDDLLGRGRADLWRRGVITLPDLLNQAGQVMTLAELRALRPAA